MAGLVYDAPSFPLSPGDNPEQDLPVCLRLISPPATNGFTGLLYNVVMALPALLFLLFLLAHLRSSVRKLLHSQSHIMAAYYAFLWVICVLNICWCLLEIQQAKNHDQETAWNIMSLLTRFGLVLLEVSVVVFMSQGYLISGWDALLRTLLFSGIFATVDAIVKAVYIFGLGIPLFTKQEDAGDWNKWGFWLLQNLFFSAVYVIILALPYTRWRDRLPARPSFYRYVTVLFALNGIEGFGSLLLGIGASFGYCVYGFASFAYYALYPPLLYSTFLSEFLGEEDVQMEDAYYSEMKDAGYFDGDWE
ncbi:protein CANDIDATE G-PROTEIN COUPLED RECEPTOR 2 [Physcomitrium patens]|uniref:Transmembrane protein adipocyte-associated 1 n=2 Tax=Physcomitrium patens TaxID=3218 RepID=A9S623_PHYPA|nr:transmembrane protein adipocyte-associated 1 homolog [Physcomitrium patens]PNR46355.1 hypothetical protein PHYPA_013474 [Physcomitrium patens]|eukprot:XP_024387486.1 transmembrane protein adipocyte-associated 1 homolog [Physcomitrella patens]